jgi:hypothetical protein
MARKPPPPPSPPVWDAPPAYTTPKGQFAADMEVTPAAVSQWIGKGMPVREDGLVDIRDAAQWLLDTLAPSSGYRTRSRAWEMKRFIFAQIGERMLVQVTVEASGAAAYEAALAAGIAADRAASLADAIAAATVERMNPELTAELNIPLSAPPPGVWRARVATVKERA